MLKLGFAVVFYRSDASIFSDASIGENIGDSIGENDTHKRILAIMKQNPKVSAKAISSEIGIAPRNVEANIRILKQAKLIDRIGPAKGGHWVVLIDA